jgi:patatin-like phospholipase/acyl hydrolase
MSYTILSFCGGGIRGLASVTMLNTLYTQYPNIVSSANMLAGTSTGAGIIAALANGQTPQDLITNFLTKEVEFFKVQNKNSSLPAYDVELFAESAKTAYGSQKLSDIKSQNVVLTSFNVGDQNTPWSPILFNNFPGSPTAGTLLADAVVSSGAMPGMFGSYQGNVDGAFVNHDPTLAAIALAVNSGIDPNDIVAICFGTGLMTNNLGSATAYWGAEQWQAGSKEYPYNVPPLLINGTASPILNISLSGTSTSLTQSLSGMMLPQRYAYLNPTLDRYIPENDTDSADLTYLQAQAAAVDVSAAAALVNAYWPQSQRSATA